MSPTPSVGEVARTSRIVIESPTSNCTRDVVMDTLESAGVAQCSNGDSARNNHNKGPVFFMKSKSMCQRRAKGSKSSDPGVLFSPRRANALSWRARRFQVVWQLRYSPTSEGGGKLPDL